jgi:capsule polysaccharide export protein KpsE/RkpR
MIDKISGYYGNTIPKDLSEQINNQRILNSIKKFEYYQIKNTVMWDVSGVIVKLLSGGFVSPKTEKSIGNPIWKHADKRINKLWWSFSTSQQNKMIEKHFSKYKDPVNDTYDSEFITGREFMKSRLGYYLTDY